MSVPSGSGTELSSWHGVRVGDEPGVWISRPRVVYSGVVKVCWLG